MRYIGLDLGTKTLGVAISDKMGLIATFLKVIHFNKEDYESAAKEVVELVNNYKIDKIALGLPKNMDNTLGFASNRSMNFKALLESLIDIPIVLVDERLTTIEAENILLENDTSRKNRKKVIDGVAATIILDTFIKMEENKHE